MKKKYFIALNCFCAITLLCACGKETLPEERNSESRTESEIIIESETVTFETEVTETGEMIIETQETEEIQQTEEVQPTEEKMPETQDDNQEDAPQSQTQPSNQQPDPQPEQPASQPVEQEPAQQPVQQPDPQPQEPEPPATSSASQPESLSYYRSSVVDIINQRRAENGLGGVSLDSSLNQAAQIRAEEIVQQFSHTRPNGGRFYTVLDGLGIGYSTAGENLAAGQQGPDSVMKEWMASEGHRANILDGSFNRVGVGCVVTDDEYGIYWVQIFTD